MESSARRFGRNVRINPDYEFSSILFSEIDKRELLHSLEKQERDILMFIYFHLTLFSIPFKCFSFTLDIIITARTKSFILHFFPLFSTLQPPTRRHHQRLCCDIFNEYHEHSTTKLLVSRKGFENLWRWWCIVVGSMSTFIVRVSSKLWIFHTCMFGVWKWNGKYQIIFSLQKAEISFWFTLATEICEIWWSENYKLKYCIANAIQIHL